MVGAIKDEAETMPAEINKVLTTRTRDNVVNYLMADRCQSDDAGPT
jgi:hypothetical protein